MTVAELIRTEREKRGWTQDDLAVASHLAKATISRIEQGESLPRGATRRKLATALNLPIEALIAPEDESTAMDDRTLDPSSRRMLEALRDVWPSLSLATQRALLRAALNADSNGDTPAKTEAS
jgi:transcriptional regulator with XRE-family HTH domain